MLKQRPTGEAEILETGLCGKRHLSTRPSCTTLVALVLFAATCLSAPKLPFLTLGAEASWRSRLTRRPRASCTNTRETSSQKSTVRDAESCLHAHQ
jgi:hypothetical protein